jgi:hypothetical protein
MIAESSSPGECMRNPDAKNRIFLPCRVHKAEEKNPIKFVLFRYDAGVVTSPPIR